jgi:hypothetical protein
MDDQDKTEQTGSPEAPEKSPKISKCRQISGLDWAAIRHAVECEGTPAVQLSKQYGVSVKAISHRRRRQNWGAGPDSTASINTEDILGMRNMRTIGRILRSMEKKLDEASSLDPAQANVVARSVQSLTRAAENAASTRRKNKAQDAKRDRPSFDRAALERKLLGMEAKLAEAAVPPKPE